MDKDASIAVTGGSGSGGDDEDAEIDAYIASYPESAEAMDVDNAVSLAVTDGGDHQPPQPQSPQPPQRAQPPPHVMQPHFRLPPPTGERRFVIRPSGAGSYANGQCARHFVQSVRRLRRLCALTRSTLSPPRAHTPLPSFTLT